MNLSKKTKAQLLDIIVERDNAIDNLKNRIEVLVKHRDELDKQFSHLVKDMDGTVQSLNDVKEKLDAVNDKSLQQVHEIQNLRANLKVRGDEYLSLKTQYDELVYHHGIAKSEAAKFKLVSAIAIIAFCVALVFALL